MTSQSGAEIKEKPPLTSPDTSRPATKSVAPVADEKSGAAHGETLPGWTIMRPVRMRGLRKGGGPSTSAPSNGSANGHARDGSNKTGDLKITETNTTGDGTGDILREIRSDDELLGEENAAQRHEGGTGEGGNAVVYKVYKRRWFGLVQLVLLNIIVSWDVSGPLHYSDVSKC